MNNETQTSRETKTNATGGKNKVFLKHIQEMSLPRQANIRLDQASKLPKISKLFGDIWSQGEIHISFAGTGLGKSILGMQVANDLSKGRQPFGFLENESDPQIINYYDFELSDKQFYNRYTSQDGRLYMFSDNLYIDQINFAQLLGKNNTSDFMEILFCKFRYDLENTGAKILFVDNITFLNTVSTADSQAGLDVMKELVELKKDYDLSIYVIAHTPKRSVNTPLTVNDLGGSSMIANFCDSISCLGSSKLGNEYVYFKQIKPSRTSEMVYDSNNVITLRKLKDDNFLRLKFDSFSSEFDHLGDGAKEYEDLTSEMQEAIELHKQNYSYSQIAERLNKSKSTIGNWIKAHKIQNESNDLPF